MDHFTRLKRQIQSYAFILGAIEVTLLVSAAWAAGFFFNINQTVIDLVVLVFGVGAAWLYATLVTNYATEPIEFLWRAILHVSPNHVGVVAPNLNDSHVGRELVTSLSLQVYQLASTSGAMQQASPNHSLLVAESMANNLPLPLFAMDKNQNITFVNEAGLHYISRTASDTVGKPFYDVLDLSFQDNQTFDAWLQDCRANKVTDSRSWERVRMKLSDQKTLRQFDMAAYYNKENSAGVETAIAFFDQSSRYSADDNALSFIALAVHELRTPLTMLRGYIEVFEDELGSQLDPDHARFMHQMNASAQQLTAFVNNILNVARIEENQLTLQLTEEDWGTVLSNAVADLTLRAQVHGLTIECSVDGNVPAVGVDKVSIYEVINNLIDNAIKYSDNGKKIVIHSYVTKDGMVETTVQDFGIGIPSSVMPHLFEKFERNHRTRSQIGGTGLGLYLSKAIINAHGGNIWVKSKEEEGSVFGFTIQPYAKLADEQKNSNNKDIVRGAHGWIKNHSLYRR